MIYFICLLIYWLKLTVYRLLHLYGHLKLYWLIHFPQKSFEQWGHSRGSFIIYMQIMHVIVSLISSSTFPSISSGSNYFNISILSFSSQHTWPFRKACSYFSFLNVWSVVMNCSKCFYFKLWSLSFLPIFSFNKFLYFYFSIICFRFYSLSFLFLSRISSISSFFLASHSGTCESITSSSI